MLPEGLDERYKALRRRPKLRAELRAEREAAVRRVAFGTAYEVWIPPVPLDPPRNEPPPRTDDGGGVLAGLDADGRPVLVRTAAGMNGEPPAAILAHPSEMTGSFVIHARLLTWEGPRLEVVGFLSHDSVSHVTWIDHDDAGRPVRFATVGLEYNALGKGASLAWCEWDGDRCARVRRLSCSDTGRWSADLSVGEYDDAGLTRVRRASTGQSRDPSEPLAALHDAEPELRWYRERDGWEPAPMAPDEALDAYARAVAEAARRAVLQAATADPLVICVWADFRDLLEPAVWIDERADVERVAARVGLREAILKLEGPSLALLPMMDPIGMRAWRSLRQQGVKPTREAAERFQHELAARSWPNDALPLLLGYGADPWELVERVLGRDRIDRLLEPLPPATAPPEIEAPPTTRQHLIELLRAYGVPEALAEQARWGLALEPRGRGTSRLGGRPDLPEGMAWPMVDDRPLTHLATIDLRELPDIDGREQLPLTGTLVFFADFTEEGALWEPTVVGEDERVRIVTVAAGERTHRPAPPAHDADEYDTPVVLRQRNVVFRPVLTLPAEPAGLAPAEAVDYEALYWALADANGLLEPGHLLLGHPVTAQGGAVDEGHVSLLHVGWDERLGFEFLDGGDITFHGAPADVAAGRWDRLHVATESN